MKKSLRLLAILQRELMKAGLTWAEVGNLIGMSERQVETSMANGSIRLKDIDKLVELLHLDFDEILNEVART
jgi:cyanate lyase